uniref:non-specific serine/threonine protein kinase n=1 Tax=Populus trichocarpa TaxID=3694 RepID=A0A2K2BUH4_POPTR
MGWSVKLLHSSVFAVCSCCLHLFILLSVFHLSNAQNATTDPSEVSALNLLFEQWDTKAVGLWNLSGEPCSGSAINGTDFEDTANNPAIKCVCTYNNSATCHITQLRVYALNKRGEIPEVITALKYLTLLKIDQNYFTGPLPAFIGNLTALQSLSIGINNFSGTLPPELGQLVNLEQLYVNSCGLGGEIPSTFVNLKKMTIFSASDAAFTGNIPDFIGNWTRLTSLRFQGNSFEGPIPSSFSNLTSLESLRISDLSNVSSTLDFIKNLKSLTDLTLRNALISGSIPSDIGEIFQTLDRLDLSFNNLTGQVPSALFNMSSLQYLFLGNNSLIGTLPNQKSSKLQTIDLSYNYLSGTFPSWVTSNIQLNLVANNFTFDSSNISVLPGLNCLQRNFPCNRNPPLYANFSIKCGGPMMRTADGTVYEAENSSISAASFTVTSTEKWAVSNAGLYADRENPSYVENNLKQVTGTNTPELYQTSRISPGSLRYYGLGLQNGPYTINLLFAETRFAARSSQTWDSLARRVFDIYIQGNRQLKDFDISMEAGGVDRAITKTFNVTVSENHLEIHLFWAGKGTCCNPVQGYYGPIISALNVVPDFTPNVSGIPSSTRKEKSRTGVIVGVSISVGVVSLILISVLLYIRLKKDSEDEEVLLGMGPRPNTFSYSQLRTATEDFSPSNKLGEGGYGPVYKGMLSDGREVAVKKLSVASNQGTNQFVTEIATISAVQHRNLVKLYGCCIEGNRRLLVYEYLENKSLDKTLFEKDGMHLDWPTRLNICLGTARGLAYLHEESRPRIVHRDVKASNILLDANLFPKISDFGLAILYDDKKTHISTRVAGTIGYLAPEYAMRGHLTEKADVFGFGVVALEILSGRANSDSSLDDERVYLLEWAWKLHESGRSLELMDPSVTEFDENEALRVVGVALLCTQGSPAMRPTMSRVVAMLTGDIEVSAVTSKPSYLTDWDFKDITGTFSTENTQASTSSEASKSKNHNPIDLIPRGDQMHSPLNVTEPRLSDLIGDGR